MARNMRKQNLKIEMLAGNSLKSFPDASSQKTMTLVDTCVTYQKPTTQYSVVFHNLIETKPQAFILGNINTYTIHIAITPFLFPSFYPRNKHRNVDHFYQQALWDSQDFASSHSASRNVFLAEKQIFSKNAHFVLDFKEAKLSPS